MVDAGQHRKDIYRELSRIVGHDLTDEETKRVKPLLQGYLLEHGGALVMAQAPTKPTVHLLVCRKCSTEMTAVGGDEFKKKRKVNFSKEASLATTN